MPAYGLSIGVATLSGRYVGAGDLAAVTRSLRSALALGAGICLCVMLGFVSFPETLVGLFATDTAVLAEARPLLLLASGFLFFDAASIIVVGALRGAGDTRFPFLYESVLSWALFLPGAWLLGVWQGGGVLGAWTAGVLYVIVLSGGMLFRFRSGAWRKVAI